MFDGDLFPIAFGLVSDLSLSGAARMSYSRKIHQKGPLKPSPTQALRRLLCVLTLPTGCGPHRSGRRSTTSSCTNLYRCWEYCEHVGRWVRRARFGSRARRDSGWIDTRLRRR